MSLKAVYERFLTSPNPLSLCDNASLNYIPTLRTFNQQGPVIRHLENQNRAEVRKKAEKIIGAIEGSNSLSLEVETTLEFISNGGAYLPGLDNFVTDRIVTFPTVSWTQTSPCSYADHQITGSCGQFRQREQDPANSYLLGSGFATDASGCHRCSGKELAHQRWKSSGSAHCINVFRDQNGPTSDSWKRYQ
jgi:hypothetical protein